MIKNMIVRHKEIMLFTIGSLLIILSVILLFYDRVLLIKEQVFTEFEQLINSEKNLDNDNSQIDVNTGYIDENVNNTGDNNIVITDSDISASKDNSVKKKYIGYLEIPKINLKYGIVAKNSYYNHVNRNIQVIKVSDFPDVEGGNLIIAGHSGNSSVSYFKNLYKLSVGDMASVTYKNNIYSYKIVDIYKEPKDGSLSIRRDLTKTTLTLITCTYRDERTQTIYIAELQKVTLGGS